MTSIDTVSPTVAKDYAEIAVYGSHSIGILIHKPKIGSPGFNNQVGDGFSYTVIHLEKGWLGDLYTHLHRVQDQEHVGPLVQYLPVGTMLLYALSEEGDRGLPLEVKVSEDIDAEGLSLVKSIAEIWLEKFLTSKE